MRQDDSTVRSLAQRVVDLHIANPLWGATIIANRLGCVDAYVRTVAKRRGLSLPRSSYAAVPTHGATYIAARRAQAFAALTPTETGEQGKALGGAEG